MSSQVETPGDLAGGTYKATVRDKAAKLKQELIKQTLDDIESWRKAVDLEYQQAHPDQPNNISPIPPEEIEGYRNTVRNEYYEWVEPAFEKYLEPDPDALNSMIGALRTIESSFGGSQDDAGNYQGASSALSRINDVRTDMAEWEGSFQVNFLDNFVSPLQTSSGNQAAVAKVSREYLECTKVMYIRYRKAVVELLDKSIQAVQTLNNGKDPKSFTWGTLIGISVGTALTLGTGGLAITGVVLIMGSTMSQGLVPDPPKTNELSAPTAQEVAVKVSEAMSKLDGDVLEEERKVQDAFGALADTIVAARKDYGQLWVATPAISDARPDEITRNLLPDS